MKKLTFVAAVALAASCAPSGPQAPPPLFSTDWTDDGGRSIGAVRARLGQSRAPMGVDIAVAVGESADKIIGLPLSGGQKWVFPHALDARPDAVGTVVVGAGGGEVFALDAKTGRKLWARPAPGMQLHGAGDDGSTTVVTMSSSGNKSSTFLAVSHDGQVLRSIETDKLLGVPAVLGKIAFVPWGNQYVTAVDLVSGDEIGRVTLRERTSRAWAQGGGLYFGEVGFFRFDDKIALASRNQATHVSVAHRELPGTPRLMPPGDQRTPAVASAPDRIRLFARPSGPDGELGIDSGRYYATYFKLVMGFESSKGGLSWVHTHASDVIGGEPIHGGLLVCDESGKLTVLDAQTGGATGTLELGEPVKACEIHVDAWSPGTPPRGHEPLAAQITRALRDPEPTLATAQRLLLRELAALEDDTATKTLVDIASDPRTSPMLVGDARTALANRRNGAKHMIEALGHHYDFLRDVLRAPPVGPIAQALAAMNEKSAAPLLAEHLLDPADTDDDVKQAAAALAVLGSEKEVPALKQFFAMYRAAADTEDLAIAVASAGQALLKLGGAQGRAIVEQASKDASTSLVAKPRLEAILQSADQVKGEPPKGGAGAAEKPEPPQRADAGAAPKATPPAHKGGAGAPKK
jgi:outer membrane protein assembly factor BamB